jgi:hypothetical protein
VPKGILCPGCQTWFSRIPYPEKTQGRCPVCGTQLPENRLVVLPSRGKTLPPKGRTTSRSAKNKAAVACQAKGRGTRRKRCVPWRAIAVAVGTAALVLLTLIFGVQVWAGGETRPEQAIVPAGLPESPKARPELQRGNPVPPENHRAPAAPRRSTQVALAHLRNIDH